MPSKPPVLSVTPLKSASINAVPEILLLQSKVTSATQGVGANILMVSAQLVSVSKWANNSIFEPFAGIVNCISTVSVLFELTLIFCDRPSKLKIISWDGLGAFA